MAYLPPRRWRRRLPTRALRRLSWYVVSSGTLAAVTWVLFAAEPARLESGETNPLTLLPSAVTVSAALGALPLLLPVLRGPEVAADHYALRIRPGALRTLLLPWSIVSELRAITIRDDPVLLVRCQPGPDPASDLPRWYDQGVLRAAGARGRGYHLAVRMDAFAGDPDEQLTQLAGWVPHQVAVTDAR